MLTQVERWAAVNSGSRNLAGLAEVADLLADAYCQLPGDLKLVEGQPVTAVDPDGRHVTVRHGRHLTLSVRPSAQVRILLTGHMDTVFGAEHAFQQFSWLDENTLNGPGVADMKGGLAVILAALEIGRAHV